MTKFNAFENIIDFSFWRDICVRHGEKQLFGRGEYVAHAGEVLKKVGWINSGGFKHSLIDNAGNSKAVGFVFKGSILANYNSVMHKKTMPTDIISLENSEVFMVSSELMRRKLEESPELNLKFAQALFEQAYEHTLDNYRYTPEQKYLQLQIRYPHLFDLVPLSEIASYLNISRRQLHRIRESLVSKNANIASAHNNL